MPDAFPRTPSMPRRMAAAALAGYAATVCGPVAAQRSLVCRAGGAAPGLDHVAVSGFREVATRTADGLEPIAWRREAAGGMPVIAVLHGAAEPKALRIAPGAGHDDLRDHGAAEVVPDFLGTRPGIGTAGPRPPPP